MLLLHMPLAGSYHAVDVHLEGDQLFRSIQCLNQYTNDFKYEHCGSLWNQPHHLSIHQHSPSSMWFFQSTTIAPTGLPMTSRPAWCSHSLAHCSLSAARMCPTFCLQGAGLEGHTTLSHRVIPRGFSTI